MEFPDGLGGYNSGIVTAVALVTAVLRVQALTREHLQAWPKEKKKSLSQKAHRLGAQHQL